MNEASSIQHYENFPVASVLCPPRLRAPVRALYHYARTADDLADEGDAPATQRLADLAAYRAELLACFAPSVPVGPAAAAAAASRWPHIFGPLRLAVHDFQLPEAPLTDLLSAFMQDVEKTRQTEQGKAPGAAYADRAELLDYCRRSANPVGRLMLHLHGIGDPASLAQSDAICTALQLINFWQDLSRDIPRGRHYLTAADRAAHGVNDADLHALHSTPQTQALIADCCAWARNLMRQGAPLVHRVPGRMAWELRFVVQGGLRILDKIEAQGCNPLQLRPRITAADTALLLWRAIGMRATTLNQPP
ncbi:squalene synthase HpnC [Hylemonella gracilis]|uniref:Squalene synthase HpnC n=1 Tax=Hylemonella gracilis TaxID=80880 RepID=A0A4P6UIE4_9BURK|nr:squalene synthase HpnC [Hylemonella gracilis]QBK05098.1 squalene synthase HpnC [Hylemonella gracilis]